MCDCDTPSAFQRHPRKARKDHKCCECRCVIAKGEAYEYASGIWDGEPSDFKTCALCVEAREEYVAQLGRYDCPPCFGDLYDDWPAEYLPPHVAQKRRAA